MESRPCTVDPRCTVREDGVILGVFGRPLTQHVIATSGYLVVTILNRKHLVNRLVALAFHGDPPVGKNFAAHGDGNKFNNNRINIRWASRIENEADKINHGRTIRGSRHPLSKLKEGTVLDIRADLESGMRVKDVGEKYGITAVQVTKIKLRRRWAHI